MSSSDSEEPAHIAIPTRTVSPDLGVAIGAVMKDRNRSGAVMSGAPDGTVAISGQVIDVGDHQPVANIEVVFKSALGEESATTGADGKYHANVQPGSYRAFVRDDTVLSVGAPERVRLPGMPSADVAGIPDEALMPLVVASADTDGVDLQVLRGGTIGGSVTDPSGHAVEGVVLRVRGGVGLRPALGTDIAESDSHGGFELKVPAGDYVVEATSDKYAGQASLVRVHVRPGVKAKANVVVTSGCVITGVVRLANGKPAGDGAIEKKWGQTDLEFGPAGKIESDGTFRWATTDEVTVTLRAWPWKSPPSNIKSFECRDGARFANVVFELPNRSPDIEGTLVDHDGKPVPFAFVDLQPLGQGGIGQQERTDAQGHWAVYAMPMGDYRVTAAVNGAGVVDQNVPSPQQGVQLRLSGVGKIEGTTSSLANGSFELALTGCGDAVSLPNASRIVTVTNGRFVVDDVPACEVTVDATWHGHRTIGSASVTAGGTSNLELALGPPHEKSVQGVVKDVTGKPVSGTTVTATLDEQTASATTDDSGHYTLKTFSGAQLFAATGDRMAAGQVGFANVNDEVVDLTLDQEIDL